MEGGLGLEKEDVGFLVGDREVVDAGGDDDEFAGLEAEVAVAEVDQEAAPDDEEELVLGVVAVPDELPGPWRA